MNITLDSPATGIWRLHQRRPVPVNAYLVEAGPDLILVDTGSPGRPGEMLGAVHAVAASTGKRLSAVALTHGHFDHVGGLAEVAAYTGVPVYTHPDELPFIRGERSYGELRGWWGYRRRGWGRSPVLLPDADLRPLPEGATLGPLRACHTPGHAPGHLAYYHAATATWLAGDLLMYNLRALTGPIWFFTYDLAAVRRSAGRLLEPAAVQAICPGHGVVLRQLDKLRAYLRRYGVNPGGSSGETGA